MAEITIEVIQPTPVNITIETAPGAAGTSVAWDNVTGKPATFAPSAHTHAASAISDSTAAGRTLLTAVDSAAQRTALALGNVDNTSDVNKPVSSATQTALNGKANTAHGHIIADVTGLQTALDGKQVAGSYAAAVHTHVIGDTTGLQTALDGKAATLHTHAIADITGLQTLLDDANGTKLNQATIKLVRKGSAGTITKGQVVYIVGSQGTHLTVELADADSEATAATTIGVAMGNITSTVEGYIIVQGFLDGLSNLPTASFTDGAALWLSSTAGEWTTTRPTQPAHGVFLGWVVSASNGASGRAYIKIINGQELDELHDVLITSPSNDQVLTYETSSGLWKNKTASSGGITNGQSIVNALIFG